MFLVSYVPAHPLFTGLETTLMMPYASTVIGVLKAALRLVETCCHISESSPALQKLREAVHEVTAELEVIATKEPHNETVKPSDGELLPAGIIVRPQLKLNVA